MGRVRLVLVGLAEPPQVRHDHVGGRRHQRDHLAVVESYPPASRAAAAPRGVSTDSYIGWREADEVPG